MSLKHKNGLNIIENNGNQKQKWVTELLSLWVTFSFFGNETYCIKEIFRGTKRRIAYKTKCIVQQLLKPKHLNRKESNFHLVVFTNGHA
jgi:hypothetical protein